MLPNPIGLAIAAGRGAEAAEAAARAERARRARSAAATRQTSSRRSPGRLRTALGLGLVSTGSRILGAGWEVR